MKKMSTAIETRTDAIPECDQCVELRDIDWKGYATMLRLRGERSVPKMVYLDGRLWLVSPSMPHERIKRRLGNLVSTILLELDIPYEETSQTTFRRRKQRGGVEGDQTFYIANAERIRGKDKLNLRVDPPPDLAIEAVHSHDATAAIEVWRRLGVPEVWVCDESELQVLVRQPNGRYAAAKSSTVLPFVSISEILDWASRPKTDLESEWREALLHWVRRIVVPRVKDSATTPEERPAS
jgi:Uma2 family endonuclease